MGCLYRVSFPNGKAYLGITTQTAQARFKDHCSEAGRLKREKPRGGSLLHHALNKYPGQAQLEVLVIADDWDYLCELEQRAIQAFGTRKPNGYNLTEGGEGTPGYRMPPESRERQRQAVLGSKWKEDAKQRFSEQCKGRVITQEAREKMAAAKRGKPSGRAKPVTIQGIHYPSILAAQKELGLGWDAIQKVLRHGDLQRKLP